MPAILFHYNFALETVPEEEKPFFDAVKLGTQGPDPFFFYGIKLGKRYKDMAAINDFGGKLHQIDITEDYLKLVAYAAKSPHRELLTSYIDGLFLHYAADRTLHPYVFARTGFDEKGELHGYYKWSHAFFEAVLDKTLSLQKGTFQNPAHTLLVKEEDQVKIISRMWFEALGAPLQEDSFYLSWKCYRFAMGFLYSKSGWKRAIFALGGKHNIAMGLAYPGNMKKYEVIDVLNSKHQPWPEPVSGEEKTLGVNDLWKKAQDWYSKAHELLLSALDGHDEESRLRALVAGVNHDGTPIGGLKKHFVLCWDQLKG